MSAEFLVASATRDAKGWVWLALEPLERKRQMSVDLWLVENPVVEMEHWVCRVLTMVKGSVFWGERVVAAITRERQMRLR